MPYDPAFERGEAHWSNLYWGASLAALDALASAQGLRARGRQQRRQQRVLGPGGRARRPARASVADAYAASRFRESRDESGELTLRRPTTRDRLRLIRDLPLVDVEPERTVTVAERFGV